MLNDQDLRDIVEQIDKATEGPNPEAEIDLMEAYVRATIDPDAVLLTMSHDLSEAMIEIARGEKLSRAMMSLTLMWFVIGVDCGKRQAKEGTS